MLLSIIIPHYNLQRELLERCIESIKAQGFKENYVETIIVDDGSSSPPLWITERFPESGIRLIIANHGGPGAARNRGIEEAKGEYIFFVDADDSLIANGALPLVLDIIKAERPQIFRLRQKVCSNRERPTVPQTTTIKTGRSISGAMFMAENNMPGRPCSYIFLRELAIKRGVMFPINCFHEDEEFNTYLHFHALSLIDSDALVYCYNIREGSTTTNSDTGFIRRRIDDMLQAITRMAEFKERTSGSSNSIQKRAITRKLDTMAADVILNMMYHGMSVREIRERCRKYLEPLSLYPITKASYSFKYRIFRIFANNKAGMAIMRFMVHGKKPKKG